MDEHLHNDRLEAFFKKALDQMQQEEAASDGWDSPSDQLWDRIESAIPAPMPVATPSREASVRPMPWASFLAVAASLLVLIVSYQWYSQSSKIDVLSEQIEGQSKTIEALTTSLEELNESKNIASSTTENNNTIESKQVDQNNKESNSATRNKEDNLSEPIAKVNKEPNEKIFPSKKQSSSTIATNSTNDEGNALKNKVSNSNIPPFPDEGHKEAISNEVLANSPFVQEQKNTINPILEEENERVNNSFRIATIATIPTTPIVYNKEELSIAKPMFPFLDPTDLPKTKGRFVLGASIRPTFAFRDIATKRQLPDNHPLKDIKKSQRSKTGLGLALNLAYAPSNKWLIESGIVVQKEKHESTIKGEFKYDQTKEQLSNGSYKSEYDVELTSAYGSSDIAVELNRATSEAIDNDKEIPFRLSAKSELSSLMIPLTVKRFFGKRPLRFSVKVGGALSFITNKTVRVDLEKQANGFQLTTQNPTKEKSLKNINNASFDYLLGIGLDYQINEHIHVAFEPIFQKSSKPVIDDKDFKSSSFALSLNTGLNYYF